MTIDARARAASTAVLDRFDSLDVPDAGRVVRRAARRRRVTAAAAALVVLAGVGVGVVAVQSGGSTVTPAPPVTVPAPGDTGWRSIDKADAGLEVGSYPTAIDADGITAMMVGLTPGDGSWDAAIWWSGDGVEWHRTPAPVRGAMPADVAIVGHVALATGVVRTSDTDDGTPFLWRSDDEGRSWTTADVDGLDGVALGSLRHFASYWIGVGEDPDGGNGVWVSRAGHAWQQVISTPSDEPLAVLEAGGSVRAFSATRAWTTTDPTAWGDPVPFEVPEGVRPTDGFGFAVQRAPGPGPGGTLVRSDDGGGQWHVDAAFAEQFPDAQVVEVAQLRHGVVAMGFDAGSTPGAWVSTDGRRWSPIPPAVRQPPGGLLALATEIDDHIVIFGTAPELERFFTYDPPEAAGPPVVPGIPGIDDPTTPSSTGGPIVPPDEQALADQLAAATPGSMEWFRLKSGIQDFDPTRATVGVSTLGQIVPFLSPLVVQNIDTLDPADYGVATTDEIPVAVGVYRGTPRQFQEWDGLMIATTVQPDGPESHSSTSASRFEGIEAVLSAP
jgi:hypothetical protein